MWRIALCLALALSGCAGVELPRAINPSGPCVQTTVSGSGKHTHHHYWKNGVEIAGDSRALADALGDFPPARHELIVADRLATAGWVMLGVGFATFVSGVISMIAAAPPAPPGQKQSAWVPGIGIAFSGQAIAVANLLGMSHGAEMHQRQAIELYNEHASEVGCRN